MYSKTCPKCSVPVDKDAAISTDVLRVSPAEVRVKECVRDAPQRLHRRLEAEPADVKLDASFLLRCVHLHRLDLAVQVCFLRGDLSESILALLGDLGERALKLRPRCGPEPHEGLVEVGAQLSLQGGQYLIEHDDE
jgi:hypothetical protein